MIETAAQFRRRNIAKLSPEDIIIEYSKLVLIEAKDAIHKEYKRYYDSDRGEYFDEKNIDLAYPNTNIQ